ncbi:uncharacterized protein LOC127741490 [Arachis duranensis]|uniref:Uncharacterized protein LOC127741490 n=1 Tax=Arachis duranensis TaxID=130453 RepID=A0A9C6TGV8_ARADU|nr:uncharacterized protein LOC127741490 [Arachis duranensis]
MIIMHSSIALLQERFRELQRVKEMREERELLKMMLNSDHQPSKSPSSPSPPPPLPPPRVSLSLWPTSSQDDKKKKTNAGVPLMMADCASKHCLHACSCEDWDSNSADSDGVDTTLRL